MKRLISALNLRFAYAIMTAMTEEDINSPQCSSIVANFHCCLSDRGDKNIYSWNILSMQLMRWTLSSTSSGTSDLNNYWGAFLFQLHPSKGFLIELLVLRPPSIEATPKCCIDKQSKTPADRAEQAQIRKRRIFLKAFCQMLTECLCSPDGNQPESTSRYASGRAGPSSAPHQRAESAFQGC